jgi:hypothetical protein
MIPTWNHVHVAIRGLHVPGPDTRVLLLAADRRLAFPLSEEEDFAFSLERNRREPVEETDAAIAWAEGHLPGAQIQLFNVPLKGVWSATVALRPSGTAAHASAQTPAFALVKAAAELLALIPDPAHKGPAA